MQTTTATTANPTFVPSTSFPSWPLSLVLIHINSPANMLPTLARRISLNPFAASKAPAVNVPYFPYTWETNPYICKRTWPPEFTKLSQKHQFKLERRYRRRAKLAYARPNWHKMVKLAQWGSILFVSVYGILFMELTDGNTPFTGVSYTVIQTTTLLMLTTIRFEDGTPSRWAASLVRGPAIQVTITVRRVLQLSGKSYLRKER
jgi:hypothetical protein